jgi:hypothetical protein
MSETPIVAVTGLMLTDVDSSSLVQCRAQIMNPSDGDFEILDVKASLLVANLTKLYTLSSHTLTLDAPAKSVTVAQFQAALQTLSYINKSDKPTEGVRNIQVICIDDSATPTAIGNVGVAQVTEVGVPDAPVLDLDVSNPASVNYTTTFTEGGLPVPITSLIQL